MNKINIIILKHLDTNESLLPPGISLVNPQTVVHNKCHHFNQAPHSILMPHPTSIPCTDNQHLHTTPKNHSSQLPQKYSLTLYVSFTFYLSQKKDCSQKRTTLLNLGKFKLPKFNLPSCILFSFFDECLLSVFYVCHTWYQAMQVSCVLQTSS